MIVLYTDFGATGPYVGQVKAVLAREAPGVAVIDLLHDAPVLNPRAAAYLLAALAAEFAPGAVFLGVVDPGVGTARRPLIAQLDGRWFVGPDNGLFNVAALRAQDEAWWEITLAPPRLSATFHGRDLFAPVAARLARGDAPPGVPCIAPARDPAQWPHDLAEVIYVDGYGNAATGLRARTLAPELMLRAAGRCFAPARTFGDAPPGAAIWYENSNGLAELAINQGNAAASCALAIGTPVAALPECP
jgi:S-adenosyl-L-methionine hydrolase (adenosine-forming)